MTIGNTFFCPLSQFLVIFSIAFNYYDRLENITNHFECEKSNKIDAAADADAATTTTITRKNIQ